MVFEVVGGVVSIAGLVAFFALLVWADREEKRIWSTGTEAERFQDLIDTVEAMWKIREVDPDLRKELSDDLTAFCSDAQANGVTTIEVFGDDLESFAESWLSEHRRPPNPLKLGLLRFISTSAGWLSISAVQRIYGALRNNTTDETWQLDVIIAVTFGIIFGVGPLLGRFVDRSSMALWRSVLLGIGAFAAMLFGSIFVLSRGAQFFFGIEIEPTAEFVPSIGPALVVAAIAIPLCLWATSSRVEENNQTIVPLFDDTEESDQDGHDE